MISRITIVILLSVKVFVCGSVIGKTKQSSTAELEDDNLSDLVLKRDELAPLDSSSPLYRNFKVDIMHSNTENQNLRGSNFRNLSVAQKIAITNSKNFTNPLLNILISGERQTKYKERVPKPIEPKQFQAFGTPQENSKNMLPLQKINPNLRYQLFSTNPSFGLPPKQKLEDSFLLKPQKRNTPNGTVVNVPAPFIPGIRYDVPIKLHKLIKRVHNKDMIKRNVLLSQLNISREILASLSLSPKAFFHQRRKEANTVMNQEHLQQQPFPNFFVKRGKHLPLYETKKGLHKRRRFDIPQIECPPTADGTDRFSCPSPDHMGRYKCIIDHLMCDGYIDCPNAEDEDRMACMFYQTTKAHLDVLADALLKWAGGHY